MINGAELIKEERQRQIEKEGWDDAHDNKQTDGALAIAGASYALGIVSSYEILSPTWRFKYLNYAIELFPYDREWFKPTPENPIKQLVKAGALIAAEIDRLQRLNVKG